MRAMVRKLLGMIGWKHVVAGVLLVLVYAGVGFRFEFLIDWDAPMDWLLTGIWGVMSFLMICKPEPRRDIGLMAVGMAGGLVIEWWGTNTLLWHYFTSERPPLWILPAWPIAALSVDRLTLFSNRVLRLDRLGRWRGGLLYWLLLPSFILWMLWFARNTMHEPSTWAVAALMVGVLLWRPRPSWDLTLFLVGATGGIFLEYWGTSRHCWTYWTEQVPPPVAVTAHGFASVAFARGLQLLDAVLPVALERDLAEP